MVKCLCLTKAGTRCKLEAQKNWPFCHLHQDCEDIYQLSETQQKEHQQKEHQQKIQQQQKQQKNQKQQKTQQEHQEYQHQEQDYQRQEQDYQHQEQDYQHQEEEVNKNQTPQQKQKREKNQGEETLEQFSDKFNIFWDKMNESIYVLTDETSDFFKIALQIGGMGSIPLRKVTKKISVKQFEIFWKELTTGDCPNSFPDEIIPVIKSALIVAGFANEPKKVESKDTCKKLGVFLWETNSCYIDSTLLSLLFTDS